MAKNRRQHQARLIKPRQQIRFAVDLVLLSLLLPVFVMAIPLTPPFSNMITGIDTETLRALFWELIRFYLINWWVIISALVLLGIMGVRVSQRIFGPLHRFETVLMQKKNNPSGLVHCKLRIGDYFQSYSKLFEQVLNESGSVEQHQGGSDSRGLAEVANSPTENSPGSDSP